MAFTHQQFLNLSITSFSCSLGWAGSQSQLTVGLVLDPTNGDHVNNVPIVGTPCQFVYDTFSFQGLLQRFGNNNSTNGFLYEALLVSPDEVLGGTQLILSGYNGSTYGIPNILNVFAYLENTYGFGSSDSNDSGMPYTKICKAIKELTYGQNGSYGGPISFKGYQYQLDLSALPNLPTYFKVGGDSISVLDFIGEVCNAAGHDWFITLVGNTITLVTVDRNTEPNIGLISQFVSTTDGAVSKDVSQELRVGTTSKFVVGGEVIQTRFNSTLEDVDVEDEEDRVIKQFWGLDADGNVILSEGEGDEETFRVDSRRLQQPGIDSTYVMDVGEIRAAAEDLSSWESFLFREMTNKYRRADMEFFLDLKDRGLNIVDEFRSSYDVDYEWEMSLDGKLLPMPSQILADLINELNPAYKDYKNNSISRTNFLFDDGTGPIRVPFNLKRFINRDFIIENYFTNIDYYFRLCETHGNVPNSVFLDDSTGLEYRDSNGNVVPVFPKLNNILQEHARVSDLYLFGNNIRRSINQVLTQRYPNFYPWMHAYYFHKLPKKENPHYQKARLMALVGDSDAVKSNLSQVYNKNNLNILYQSSPFTRHQTKFAREDLERGDDSRIDEIYSFVRQYYEECYGRRYMVRIPFLFAKVDGDSGEVKLSQEVADAGFIDEQYWDDAISANYLPINQFKLLTEDNRFHPYVRYDNIWDFDRPRVDDSFGPNIDLSKFNDEDLEFSIYEPYSNTIKQYYDDSIHSSGVASVFIKSTLEDQIVFTDYPNRLGPRVILTLPERVNPYWGLNDAVSNGGTKEFLERMYAQQMIEDEETIEEEPIKSRLELQLNSLGIENHTYSKTKEALTPNFTAICLRSKILSYGPWYAYGVDGKTEFERDESLVPWNFNGFTNMNLAGNSKVENALTIQTVSEAGSVTFPGVPALGLGSALISGGPYVTDISTDIGPEGVTTTYRMQTWTPRYGRLSLQGIQKLQNMSRISQQIKRNQLNQIRPVKDKFFTNRALAFLATPKRRKKGTSHTVIAGELIGNTYAVASQPAYNVAPHLETNYFNKGLASLDSLFVPFAAYPSYSGSLMKFEEPTASSPNVNDLNPFKDGNPYGLALVGEEVPEDGLAYSKGNAVRSIAHRAPFILAGSGFDNTGVPVDGKVGPVDYRWDDARKVWEVGTSLTEGFFVTHIPNSRGNGSIPSSGLFQPFVVTSGGFTGSSTLLTVISRDDSLTVPSGYYGIITTINGEKRPIYVSCY